jgi:hypothetical protein
MLSIGRISARMSFKDANKNEHVQILYVSDPQITWTHGHSFLQLTSQCTAYEKELQAERKKETSSRTILSSTPDQASSMDAPWAFYYRFFCL